jgi:hypothetical protein
VAKHTQPDGQLYLSGVVVDELDQAQAELDEHLPSGSDGKCLCCREEIPCWTRERASLTFRRYGVLPRRRPGLARVRPVATSSVDLFQPSGVGIGVKVSSSQPGT